MYWRICLTDCIAGRISTILFKAVCIPGYLIYVLACVYAINGARIFLEGFWQMLVILSIMNLIDRFLIDDYWVGHTLAWEIPGTEDLKPYITAADKKRKWIMGTWVWQLYPQFLRA